MTKIIRTYTSICTSCGGTGIIRGIDLYVTNTNICPVCNGAKTIVVTEEYDALYTIDTSNLSPLITTESMMKMREAFKKSNEGSGQIVIDALYSPVPWKALRKEKGLSLRDVSFFTKISISTISRLERGVGKYMFSTYNILNDFYKSYGTNENK